jgi:hypothetical protein
MVDADRLHHLAGEVSALRAFAKAVIASHPDVTSLAAEFERLTENQIALSVGETVFDPYLEGQRATIDDLRGNVDAQLAR